MNVTVIDYGVGNLRSLRRGLERAGATVETSADPAEIADAPALVLPGVGAFGECVRNSAPFHDALVEAAADTPILGVCVGLQLMYEESTETSNLDAGAATGPEAGTATGPEAGDGAGTHGGTDPRPGDGDGGAGTGDGAPPTVEGLGLLPGRVERLPSTVTVPQMGWNELRIERDHPVVEGIADGDYAYFVHSYCAPADRNTVATCDYGREFAAVAANPAGNVVGTQFHPEKSGETGLRLLANFVEFAESYRRDRRAALD